MTALQTMDIEVLKSKLESYKRIAKRMAEGVESAKETQAFYEAVVEAYEKELKWREEGAK